MKIKHQLENLASIFSRESMLNVPFLLRQEISLSPSFSVSISHFLPLSRSVFLSLFLLFVYKSCPILDWPPKYRLISARFNALKITLALTQTINTLSFIASSFSFVLTSIPNRLNFRKWDLDDDDCWK